MALVFKGLKLLAAFDELSTRAGDPWKVESRHDSGKLKLIVNAMQLIQVRSKGQAALAPPIIVVEDLFASWYHTFDGILLNNSLDSQTEFTQRLNWSRQVEVLLNRSSEATDGPTQTISQPNVMPSRTQLPSEIKGNGSSRTGD